MSRLWVILVLNYGLVYGSLKDGYDNIQWGQRLQGKLLTVITQCSVLTCAEECLIRPACLSFNYMRATIFCELNYDTSNEVNSSTGWIFSRRETWPMGITGSCQESSCSLNEKCKSGPFQSFKCETSHCYPQSLTLPSGVKPFSPDTALDLNSAHKIECDDNMVYRSGSKFVRCLQNGTWSNPDLQCDQQSCRYSCEEVNPTGGVDWMTAQEECRSRGASLAEADLPDEWRLIKNAVLVANAGCTYEYVWIGGRNNRWVTSGNQIQQAGQNHLMTDSSDATDIDNSCVRLINRNMREWSLLHSDCTTRLAHIMCEKETTCF